MAISATIILMLGLGKRASKPEVRPTPSPRPSPSRPDPNPSSEEPAWRNRPKKGWPASTATLLEKTGKSIDEWAGIARSTGLGKHKDIVAHLKADHGLSHGYANQIAQRALAADDAPEPAATTWSRPSTPGRRPNSGRSTTPARPPSGRSAPTSSSRPRRLM